jgi:phosphate transport system substrate-binding protein
MGSSSNHPAGRGARRFALLLVVALAATACAEKKTTTGGTDESPASNLSGTIRIDGSSTVAPLSEAAAELFREENPDVQVTVGTSGTGGGFKKFCAGETDISDASRPIKDPDEVNLCKQNGVEYDSFQVANDGIALVVNKENNWVDCLTKDQLKKIWDQGSTVKTWKEVDPKFPAETLALFGAGTDSGTFDFFTQAINGKEKQSRSDYNATEDDNVTVQGVSGTKGGLGYFGLSYYEENQEKLKVLKVDGGGGCVEPSTKTVQDKSYKPLSRPLFIYPNAKALARPEVEAFIEFYAENANEVAEQALYVPLTDEQTTKLSEQIEELKKKAGG